MTYFDYKNSRDLAWQILIEMGISELPVKITSICKQMGIRVYYYHPTDGNSGECRIIDDTYCIFVNKAETAERKRFTIAHELGHILLGHVGKYELVNREPQPTDNRVERAANIFASRLLAPACVLHELGVSSAEQIAKVCDISITSAEFRYARLNLLKKRNKFYLSPLERKVHKQFKSYIKRNRKKYRF